MTHTIKFRGKTKEGEWEYGSLVQIGSQTFIVPYHQSLCRLISVNPDTVGRYLPIKNGSGNGIYENDIVEFCPNYTNKPTHKQNAQLVFAEYKWVLRNQNGDYDIEEETDEFYYKSKIIGNIHDNPDLS